MGVCVSLPFSGTLAERAERLFGLVGLASQADVPKKARGPGFPGKWP